MWLISHLIWDLDKCNTSTLNCSIIQKVAVWHNLILFRFFFLLTVENNFFWISDIRKVHGRTIASSFNRPLLISIMCNLSQSRKLHVFFVYFMPPLDQNTFVSLNYIASTTNSLKSSHPTLISKKKIYIYLKDLSIAAWYKTKHHHYKY